MAKIPYLFLRGGSYIYRRGVPKKYRELLGRREFLETFGAVSLAEATVRAARLAEQHTALLEAARTGQPAHAGPAVREEARRLAASGKQGEYLNEASQEAYERYIEEVLAKAPRPRWELDPVKRAILNNDFAVTMMDALKEVRDSHGAPKDIAGQSKAVEYWMSVHPTLDVRKIKHSDVLKFRDALRRRGTLSDVSIKKFVSYVRAILNRYLRAHDLAPLPNLFADLNLKPGGATDRLPFLKVHLAAIDEQLLRTPAHLRLMLQFMKYSGCGVGETIGIKKTELKNDYVAIIENDVRELKTGLTRERLIPLTDTLKQVTTEALKLPDTKTGLFAAPGSCPKGVSVKLNAVIDRAGVRSRRLSAYSFRHTLSAAMLAIDTPERLHSYLFGWSEGKSMRLSRYGNPIPDLQQLRLKMEEAYLILGLGATESYTDDELTLR